jgi:cystathionine beta-lyase
MASWLEARPEIAFLRHPGLPSHPQHELWARDFSGASGLFSVFFKPGPSAAFEAFVNALELFAIGSSWGGYESLVQPVNLVKQRSATTWDFAGPGLRIHAGLENIDDLIADLENAFSTYAKHA